MAKKQSFLLVSLSEDKAKKLAQIISNDTCRKVLDYLADRQDATESELAKTLELPISTVHYNLQHLQEGGLVEVDEFHYSEKGKEVNHYKLANKYIIIAPKSTFGLKEKLKSILPVAVLAAGAALFIQYFNRFFGVATFAKSAEMPEFATAMADEAVRAAPEVAKSMAEDTMAAAPQVAERIVETAVTVPLWQNIAFWFLVGAIFAIVVYLIVEAIRRRKD